MNLSNEFIDSFILLRSLSYSNVNGILSGILIRTYKLNVMLINKNIINSCCIKLELIL